MCWRPCTLNVLVLLYGAMVLVAFLLVMSSPACVFPPIILCVSAVLVAVRGSGRKSGRSPRTV